MDEVRRPARLAARFPRATRALQRLDAAGSGLGTRLASDPCTQWCAFFVLLALRCVALALMMVVREGPDGMGDEVWLYLQHVRLAPTLGFANPGYEKGAVMWHAPLSYAFWSGALSMTQPTIEAGRIVALVLYLCSALLWVLIVRLLFPRGQRVVPAAAFWIAPMWHAMEIRAYGLFLLLLLASTYFAVASQVVAKTLERGIALLGLAFSLALLVYNHMYGLLGAGCVVLTGLVLVRDGRERGTGLAYVLCATIAVASFVPWVADLAHERRALLPRYTAERVAGVAEAAAHGVVDPTNVDQYRVNAFSTWDDLRDELRTDVFVNLVTIAALVVAGVAWARGRSRKLVWIPILFVLTLSSRNTLPQVAALVWMARCGPAWRDWRLEWLPVLLVGTLPAVLQYPAFYDNYLTGYRVLPFLLLADVVRQRRWDWPARIALFHLVGLALDLVRWMTADPLHGGMPS